MLNFNAYVVCSWCDIGSTEDKRNLRRQPSIDEQILLNIGDKVNVNLKEIAGEYSSFSEEHKHDEDDAVEMDDLIGEVDEEMGFYDTNNDGYM